MCGEDRIEDADTEAEQAYSQTLEVGGPNRQGRQVMYRQQVKTRAAYQAENQEQKSRYRCLENKRTTRQTGKGGKRTSELVINTV